jgi:hypothetical protein
MEFHYLWSRGAAPPIQATQWVTTESICSPLHNPKLSTSWTIETLSPTANPGQTQLQSMDESFINVPDRRTKQFHHWPYSTADLRRANSIRAESPVFSSQFEGLRNGLSQNSLNSRFLRWVIILNGVTFWGSRRMELRFLSHCNLGDMTFVWCLFIHSTMDLRFTLHLGQMESSRSMGLFSKLQISLAKAHIDGSSYTSIRKTFKICNDEAIARCLVRSVLRFSWDRTCQDGQSAYLSDLDKMQLEAIVFE